MILVKLQFLLQIFWKEFKLKKISRLPVLMETPE